METIEILNVTVIEPRLKHPTIFERFDKLAPGEAFIIHNDHDPKPLYYQLLGERGNIFQWEYLEEGPEWWKVKIAKNDDGKGNVTVGEIAAKYYRKAEVFKRMGIDFCCGGKKTLSEACAEAGITEAQLEAELQKAENAKKSPSQDYDKWELDFLVDYIVNTHHRYVKENVEMIYQLAQKVASHHGEAHPEFYSIGNTYVKLANDLLQHIQKEEQVLFPYIKELAVSVKIAEAPPTSPFGTVKNPIGMMQAEHEQAGEDFSKIREMSDNYAVPADACNSVRFYYEKLREFEDDLIAHVHLENNILFPKAINLERERLS